MINRRTSRGFIFLMTLIMVSVISLLVLTCMQHVLMYHKALNSIEEQHHNFYQLETVAMQLAQSKLSKLDKNCIESGDSGSQIKPKLLRQEGCNLAVKGVRYRYFIEDLGEFACLVVQTRHGKHPSHHIRVSVMVNDEALIQIRTIKEGWQQPCAGEEHRVTLGVSSWRYFASV